MADNNLLNLSDLIIEAIRDKVTLKVREADNSVTLKVKTTEGAKDYKIIILENKRNKEKK